MGLFLNTNVASLNAQRNFGNVTQGLNKSIQRLSTGLRINKASDGAGSLLLADDLQAQTRGFAVAEKNIQQGINVLNIADAALGTINDDLQRLREVALEASNGTVSDFTAYAAETTQIIANISAVANGTVDPNGTALLAGAITLNIQAGADSGGTNVIDIGAALSDNTAATLTVAQSPTSNANATTLLGQVDAAISTVATNRATIGGMTNQLENRLEFVQIAKENTAASESLIRNVDVAEETANLTKMQILQQASALALSSANQAPNIALGLLR